ncbi:MAG: ribosomal-processing cysteine protease Prp [Micromonosporaceae bacterium]|nr:ribosomal-processing cysteine protease Prp [Micromonosporaceae bacterium]
MIGIRAHLGDGLTRIEVTGHEGHREQGRVCAAVSAITHTALLGLQAVAAQHPDLVNIEITQETTP